MIDTVIIPPSGVASKGRGVNAKPACDAFVLCVLEAAARRAGVAAVDALALHVLAARGGTVERAHLARELVLDGPACSRLLNRLEAADFAVRLCGSDRRTLEVELVDDGWDAAEWVSAAFSDCVRDVARAWEEALSRDVPGGGRLVAFGDAVGGARGKADCELRADESASDGGGADVDGDAVCGAVDFRDDMTLDDALAANGALAQLCEEQRLTRTQALCLMVVQASGVNAFAPHAATAIAQAASLSRTTARSALWALRKRGLL